MEYRLGNIFVRDCGSPHEKGWKMEGHEHNFDHVTYIIRGKYRCRRWVATLTQRESSLRQHMIKSKFDDSVRSKSEEGMVNEALCMNSLSQHLLPDPEHA